jgi:hypothetical protein
VSFPGADFPGGGAGVVTARQKQLIVELVRQPTIRLACHVAKVNDRQFRRWKHQPDFARLLAAAREEVFQEGLAHVKASVARAGDVVNELLYSKDNGERLRAAKVLLDVGLRAAELMDLLRDVEQLKRQVAENAEHGGTQEGSSGAQGDVGPADTDGGGDTGGDPG